MSGPVGVVRMQDARRSGGYGLDRGDHDRHHEATARAGTGHGCAARVEPGGRRGRPPGRGRQDPGHFRARPQAVNSRCGRCGRRARPFDQSRGVRLTWGRSARSSKLPRGRPDAANTDWWSRRRRGSGTTQGTPTPSMARSRDWQSYVQIDCGAADADREADGASWNGSRPRRRRGAPRVVVPTTMTATVGSLVGSRLSDRLRTDQRGRGFAVLLLVVAGVLLAQ